MQSSTGAFDCKIQIQISDFPIKCGSKNRWISIKKSLSGFHGFAWSVFFLIWKRIWKTVPVSSGLPFANCSKLVWLLLTRMLLQILWYKKKTKPKSNKSMKSELGFQFIEIHFWISGFIGKSEIQIWENADFLVKSTLNTSSCRLVIRLD